MSYSKGKSKYIKEIYLFIVMFQRISVSHSRLSINDLLSGTLVPCFQRLDDKEHTDRIAAGLIDYHKRYDELALIGSISLANLNRGKYIILDGQHRLRALEKVIEVIPDLRWNVVRVDIYEVESEEEAKGIYQIINSSKKVELFTGDVTPFIIPQVQRYLRERYVEYCKTSRRPLGLNFNLETLAKHLVGKKVIEKLGLGVDGADLLIQKIKQLNQFYSDQPPLKFIEWGVKDYDKRYKELVESKDPFYLGLYRQYEWVDRLADPLPYEEQSHRAIVIKKRDVPTMTRRKLWERCFDKQVEGICYCCSAVIRLDDFHAAHRVSFYEGGSNEVENLEAACDKCNIEMGTMHIDEYRKLFH